jgi:hypothetical protein
MLSYRYDEQSEMMYEGHFSVGCYTVLIVIGSLTLHSVTSDSVVADSHNDFPAAVSVSASHYCEAILTEN